MNNELTNLLPAERMRALRRNYFISLGVTAFFMITVLIGVTAVLLLPSYVFLIKSENVKKSHLANIEATFPSIDEKKLSERLSALSSETATLTSIANVPSTSSIIRKMLATPRSGIVLSGLSYTSPSADKPLTLVVSGTAMTRDSLRKYQLALQSSPGTISADLPVSAYAKDSQISFSITLTLKP